MLHASVRCVHCISMLLCKRRGMYPFSPRCLWLRNHFGNCPYELRREHVANTSLIALFLLFFQLPRHLSGYLVVWLADSSMVQPHSALILWIASVRLLLCYFRRAHFLLPYLASAEHVLSLLCLLRIPFLSAMYSNPLCAIFGECSSHILLIYHVLLLCRNAIRRMSIYMMYVWILRFHKKGQWGFKQSGRLLEFSIVRKLVANLDITLMRNNWFVWSNTWTVRFLKHFWSISWHRITCQTKMVSQESEDTSQS